MLGPKNDAQLLGSLSWVLLRMFSELAEDLLVTRRFSLTRRARFLQKEEEILY